MWPNHVHEHTPIWRTLSGVSRPFLALCSAGPVLCLSILVICLRHSANLTTQIKCELFVIGLKRWNKNNFHLWIYANDNLMSILPHTRTHIYPYSFLLRFSRQTNCRRSASMWLKTRNTSHALNRKYLDSWMAPFFRYPSILSHGVCVCKQPMWNDSISVGLAVMFSFGITWNMPTARILYKYCHFAFFIKKFIPLFAHGVCLSDWF